MHKLHIAWTMFAHRKNLHTSYLYTHRKQGLMNVFTKHAYTICITHFIYTTYMMTEYEYNQATWRKYIYIYIYSIYLCIDTSMYLNISMYICMLHESSLDHKMDEKHAFKLVHQYTTHGALHKWSTWAIAQITCLRKLFAITVSAQLTTKYFL